MSGLGGAEFRLTCVAGMRGGRRWLRHLTAPCRSADVDTGHSEPMTTTIVLNGPSSAGKSTLGAALQLAWDSPLLVTGVDTFLAGFPERLFSLPDDEGVPGPSTSGFHVLPGRGPEPSWIPAPGADGLLLMRAAHRAWRAIADTGLDQVIDHVILDAAMREDALEALKGPDVLWVGVHCDVEELVRREAARGDRFRGFASGTWAQVHDGMTYDLLVDTGTSSTQECADQVVAALRARRR